MMEGVKIGMIYLLYCKSFCGYQNVPPFSTTIKRNKDTIMEKKKKKTSPRAGPTQLRLWDFPRGPE
jgi:hypothetical protein